MTVKELKDLYFGLEKRVTDLGEKITTLDIHIINHTGTHNLDRIVQYIHLGLLIIVILLLKFKIL